MEKTLENWLILYFSWLSANRLKKLRTEFKTLDEIISAEEKHLRSKKVSAEIIGRIKNPDQQEIQKSLEFLEKNDHHIITLDDPRYPPLLKEIVDPPLLLFVWGDPNTLLMPNIAIVGSRNPTPSGIENAFYFAKALSENGFCISSGLAIGIDTQAHKGALNGKGKTLAFLGSGLNRIYPNKNKLLAESISENGAVISEFPVDTPPNALHFPKRNRLIAGISMGTLIVEAALKSGSLITARLAMEYNREVFAIPGSIHSPQSKGCHALIKDGAILTEDVNDVLKEVSQFAINPNNPISQNDSSKHPDPEYQLLLDAIGFDQASVDQLVSRLGLGAGSVCSLLVNLEIQGYIKAIPGGYIRVKR